MSSAKTTVDHDIIRQWVEARGGHPTRVIGTGAEDPTEDPGLLRIDFPGFSGEDRLEAIPWEVFFEAFDDNDLAFLYQDEVEGSTSRFHKFVRRSTAAARAATSPSSRDQGSRESQERGAPGESKPEASREVFELLKRDHRTVEDLFDRAMGRDGAEDRSVISDIGVLLQVHTALEERYFYAAVREAGDAESRLIDEAEGDHALVSQLLEELADLELNDPSLPKKLQELRRSVEEHVAIEESSLFDVARRVLEPARLERIAEEMRSAREALARRVEEAGMVRRRGASQEPAHGA